MSMDRNERQLFWGIPVIVVAGALIWVLWRATADLDDIESRQLAWGTVGTLLGEHVVLTLICAAVVLVVGVPLGIALTRPGIRRVTPAVLAVANAGQSAPVIGLVVLLAMAMGFGTPTAVVALSIYAFLPVLANTITGLQGVDPALVEAGRGMGISSLGVLLRIELPLASKVILAGIRTALVLLVGTASFATFINAGGLGALIQTGISLFRFRILISGAVIVALLALLVEWLGQVMEMVVAPKGL
ncbi:ABC transporter permease [Propionibacterium australiense]|uniref:Binding-protein-dependent transport system inner membrane component n=1 Tax=Propionibacterium australiense TaxID=119981 RepID=A0A383S7D1_9ACTN|nr:ABC transporter permease [Propionibacterium australiense]RLP08734.1 ABC transporter permease subunit [Propionibacterium australiense]SYZ33314.1 Binding-protein-dependent transport system inner membrane component [Propionibacterium australiense]VEH89783.1 Putative osmoprotectant uptake system permease protein yehW [Propionibacterium australiense]